VASAPWQRWDPAGAGETDMAQMHKFVVLSVLAFAALIGATDQGKAQAQTVSIVIVRHGESDNTLPTIPLSARGMARADLLIHTLGGVKFTHVFSSHTTRSRQQVEKVAAAHKLPVVQLPAPGSTVDGKPVTDQTTRRAPIEPVSEALLKLPAGSVALVGLNSENTTPSSTNSACPWRPRERPASKAACACRAPATNAIRSRSSIICGTSCVSPGAPSRWPISSCATVRDGRDPDRSYACFGD